MYVYFDNDAKVHAPKDAARLAERLGETRAASRAHGIFGRVFGRIGDTAAVPDNIGPVPGIAPAAKQLS